jgi:hypothetical protein
MCPIESHFTSISGLEASFCQISQNRCIPNVHFNFPLRIFSKIAMQKDMNDANIYDTLRFLVFLICTVTLNLSFTYDT